MARNDKNHRAGFLASRNADKNELVVLKRKAPSLKPKSRRDVVTLTQTSHFRQRQPARANPKNGNRDHNSSLCQPEWSQAERAVEIDVAERSAAVTR